MKHSGLSKKRRELLQVIDRYGILTREQILARVDIAYKNMVYGIKQLEELGYIATYKLGRGYAHYITNSGSKYVGLINFGYVKNGKKKPNLAVIEHNLLVNDCMLEDIAYIRETLGDIPVSITTEREHLAEIMIDFDLRQRISTQSKNPKIRNKIPDYLLSFENDGVRITNAYEVELTRKSNHALKAKLSWYKDEVQRKTYDNVWYITSQESIENYVKINANQVGLKVFFRKIEDNW